MNWYLRVLNGLLATIGISGALVGTGFLINTGFQDRLGYQIQYSNSIPTYLTLAGSFLVNTSVMILEWTGEHFFKTVLIVAVSAILGFLVQWTTTHLPRMRLLLTIGLAICCFVEVVNFNLPGLALKNLLVRDVTIGLTFPSQTWIDKQAYQLWLHEVCSRTVKNQNLLLGRVGIICDGDPDSHTKSSRDFFLLNFILTILLCFMGSLVILGSVEASEGSDPPTQTPLTTLGISQAFLVIFLAVDLIFLPYTYAKTRHSTDFDEVIVRVDYGGKKESVVPEHGFLLSGSEHDVVLFHKKEDQIWVVPRSKIVLIKVERKGDVLEYHLAKSIELLRAKTDAPP